MSEHTGDLVLYELNARDAWAQRDYEQARDYASKAIEVALSSDDQNAWWNMSFLQAECFRKEGAMEESVSVAQHLRHHSLTASSTSLAARVSTSIALAQQGLGKLTEAVDEAKRAVTMASTDSVIPELSIEAQNALIAALAESDRLDDAWAECLILSDLITPDVNTQTAGMTYWAIGNVAFLRHEISEGAKYHSLAATRLSPTNDLDLWARFNLGSAAKRLAAGVVTPETLECIERAEMASSTVGGSERDRLEILITRAHWLFLTGKLDPAIERLRLICAESSLLATQTAGEAYMLLGQALSERGDFLEAYLHLEASEDLFNRSGAYDREAHVRSLMDEFRRPPN